MEEKQRCGNRCLRGRRFTKCWLFRKRVGNEERELELKTVNCNLMHGPTFKVAFANRSSVRLLTSRPKLMSNDYLKMMVQKNCPYMIIRCFILAIMHRRFYYTYRKDTFTREEKFEIML